MPKLADGRIPKYRKHKKSGQAIVTLSGVDHYLGPHGTKASAAEYDRVTSEWLANGRRLPAEREMESIAVAQLLAAYLTHAKSYYVKGGRETPELGKIRSIMSMVRQRYGRSTVDDFGPLALKAIRQSLVDADLARSYINGQVAKVVRIFRWGVANELVPSPVLHALEAVGGLKAGRSKARETDPVKPVPDQYVDAVRDHVGAQVWAMVQLQRVTGMRSGEVTAMRGCDLDTDGKLWTYRPQSHKAEHHGHVREIEIGPQSQAIIKPFLRADLKGYLFRPADVVSAQNVERRRNRLSPMTPSQRKRGPKESPKRTPGERYTKDSYYRAIQRACDKADAATKEAKGLPADSERIIPRWHPHQLRHNFATNIRKRFGIEAARILCGHKSMAVTEVYSEIDRAKVASIVAKVG